MQKSTIFKTTTNPPFKTAADEKTNDPQITTVRNQQYPVKRNTLNKVFEKDKIPQKIGEG